MPAPKLQNLRKPLLYLITNGETTEQTTPATKEFSHVLRLIEAAVTAGIDLIQLREKCLSARMLYELALRAASITRDTTTRLLINDRADIASDAGAAGVHLTTRSLPADVVRRSFGDDFLIGVSTHSTGEASDAAHKGADFVVFGPVFETASKTEYGEPQGLGKLERVCAEVSPCPVLALGGITIPTVAACMRAGAWGIAGIGIFADPDRLGEIVKAIHESVAKG